MEDEKIQVKDEIKDIALKAEIKDEFSDDIKEEELLDDIKEFSDEISDEKYDIEYVVKQEEITIEETKLIQATWDYFYIKTEANNLILDGNEVGNVKSGSPSWNFNQEDATETIFCDVNSQDCDNLDQSFSDKSSKDDDVALEYIRGNFIVVLQKDFVPKVKKKCKPGKLKWENQIVCMLCDMIFTVKAFKNHKITHRCRICCCFFGDLRGHIHNCHKVLCSCKVCKLNMLKISRCKRRVL